MSIKFFGERLYRDLQDQDAKPSSRSPPSVINWRGTWLSTYVNIKETRLSKINCANLFSDVLYRPFFCAHSNLFPYTTNLPSRTSIPRLQNLSASEFSSNWTNKPFILKQPVRDWPAYQEWSLDYLLKKYGQVEFRAEAVDWPLKTYVDYMKNNQDECPLYLFDRSFVEKMGIQIGEYPNSSYWRPECFGEDLFGALGSQRPDSRWLIIGPARSGSTFHKDPNATRLVRQSNVENQNSDIHVAPGTLSFADQNTGSCFPPLHLIHPLPESSFLTIKAK